MKVLFLSSNSEVTMELLSWLAKREEVVEYSRRLTPEVLERIAPDLIISYNYRYIISPAVLNMFDHRKLINLHISLLPWNRGAHPNVWSFVEDTPKGVTIHLIDEGIDTGDILLQREVHIDEKAHTLRSSYELLHEEIQKLFRENWERLRTGSVSPKPQVGKGSFHTKKDFERIRPLLGDKGWDIPIVEFKERLRRFRKCGKI